MHICILGTSSSRVSEWHVLGGGFELQNVAVQRPKKAVGNHTGHRFHEGEGILPNDTSKKLLAR